MEEQEDGAVLGVVDIDTVVFFIKNMYTGKDSIKVYDGNDISTLYEGNLNFDIEHPIEGIFNFETETVQKVYWVDGINQLRCINIVADLKDRNMWDDEYFNVVQVSYDESLGYYYRKMKNETVNSWRYCTISLHIQIIQE